MNNSIKSPEKEWFLKEVWELQQEMVFFFERAHKLHLNILEGDSRKLLFSFVDDITTPWELVLFFQLLRTNLGWIRKIPDEISLSLYADIFQEINKKRNIFRYSSQWKVGYISVLFHHLRDVGNVPQFFIEDMQSQVYRLKPWNPASIAEVLRFAENYRNTHHGKKLIRTVWGKIFSLDFQSLAFRSIQKLIINLEHADVEIPIDLLDRWNTLQNEEGEKNFVATQDEERIVRLILENVDSFEGFALEQNVFICGYEVDIVMYDTQGNIFAIIESDGNWHFSNPKVNNKDKRRDALFLRKWITDTIIRCMNFHVQATS